MVNFKQLLLALTLASLPTFASAQESCDLEQQSELLNCIEESKYACLDIVPSCSEEDLDDGANEEDSSIAANVAEKCCYKKAKGQRISCLKDSINTLKKAKSLLGSALYSKAKEELQSYLDELKLSGECYSDEDDSDDGDWEDEYPVE